MRVLMVCPELPSAGRPGRMAPCSRQIRSLVQLGISVDVVDLRGIPKLKYLQVLPRVRRQIRNADVVHAHFGYCGWLSQFARMSSATAAPLVVSFMGDDLLGTPINPDGDLERLSRWMITANRRLARRVDQVIVKSQEMADVIASVRSTVIPNGVDLDRFRPGNREAARKQLGLPADRKIVLFPGNPQSPGKGHHLASNSVGHASAQLGEPVDLLPLWGVDPEHVVQYMNACDAMLMTSLSEGSPNVVKEAMACDLAVISVPVGDVPELIRGVPGYALCDRDAMAVGDALANRLKYPTAVDGRRVVTSRGLDLESVARRILAVYEQALGEANASSKMQSPDDAAQGSTLRFKSDSA